MCITCRMGASPGCYNQLLSQTGHCHTEQIKLQVCDLHNGKRTQKSTYSSSKLLVKLVNDHKVDELLLFLLLLLIIICVKGTSQCSGKKTHTEDMHLKYERKRKGAPRLCAYQRRCSSCRAETSPRSSALQLRGHEYFCAAHWMLRLKARPEMLICSLVGYLPTVSFIG